MRARDHVSSRPTNKSKVLAAPVGKVYRAFRDARTRRRWLGDVKLDGAADGAGGGSVALRHRCLGEALTSLAHALLDEVPLVGRGAVDPLLCARFSRQITSMHTALCDRLGIALPIIQAPMAGGWTTPELVAAVSEAGGLGMLAGARLTADQLRSQIDETRRRTSRPFGVNFLLAPPLPPGPDEQRAFALLDRIRVRLGLPMPGPGGAAEPAAVSPEEGLEIALAAGIRIISFAMGSPGPHAAQVHASGALLMVSITTVREAHGAADAGADVIVAQGSEAGGHRSTFEAWPLDALPLVGTMALVPTVVDAVDAPVVAAGGIMDGRGIAAALALGAGAAQLGTRFLLAHESGTSPPFRRRLLEAGETDTVVTDLFTGRAARALRNAFVRAFAEESVPPLPWPHQAAAAMDIYRASLADDGDWAPLYAGQGLRLAAREQPAAEIVRELAAELERARNHTR